MCAETATLSFMWYQPCGNQTVPLQFEHAASLGSQNTLLIGYSHSFRITCDTERNESAREQRTALYESDQYKIIIGTKGSMPSIPIVGDSACAWSVRLDEVAREGGKLYAIEIRS